MTRVAVALAVLAAGLVSLDSQTPTVPSAAPSAKHRYTPFKVSRSMRRLPLASKPDTAKASNTGPRRELPIPRGPRSGDLREPADVLDWNALAACESSGNWQANTGNGYFGGLQQNLAFWANYGGLAYAPRPDLATREQQIAVARRGLAVQGPEAWPVCSLRAAA